MDYEILDHTADVGVRVYGSSLADLLKNAAVAMMDLIADRESVESQEEVGITAEGETEEELLVHWLEEILYIHKVKKMVFKDFEVKLDTSVGAASSRDMPRQDGAPMSSEGVVAQGKAFGEKMDFDKHELHADIKAVTFHNLKLERVNNRLTAEIIFDI